MNSVNTGTTDSHTVEKDREQMGKNAVAVFLNSIREIGYDDKKIMTIVKEELK